MAILIEISKLSGGPGSVRLLLMLLAAGLAVLVALPRWRRAGILWICAVSLSYGVMALPAVARLTVEVLPASKPAADADLSGIQTLFFFDGDNRWGRLREFERIDRLAQPHQIYLLGRLSVYKDLRLMGVPSRRIVHDDTLDNTSDQITRTIKVLKAGDSGQSAILVSCLQAPRVRLLADKAGLTLPVLAAPLDDELPHQGLLQFVPSFAALAVTRDAIYELAALLYYSR